jgi:hypothetical protein
MTISNRVNYINLGVRILANGKLEKLLNEAVVVYFKILYQHFS